MTILDHEHHLNPVEGPLLLPQQKSELQLDLNKHFYINGRCDLLGCNYYTFTEIPTLKIRGSRLAGNRK